MFTSFKLARTLPRYRNADVLVLSIGKSGRTWLRVLLNKYLSLRYGLEFSINDMSKHDGALPSVIYAHELWMHHSEAKLWQYLSGKHIIPDGMLFSKKAVLLARDPRDVVVSLFFQVTKRRKGKKNAMDCEIGEFIKHKKYGVNNMVKVLNRWRKRLREHHEFILLRYEDMHRDTLGELKRVLGFIGMPDVDLDMAREAVDFASFKNMKRMETGGEFDNYALSPADPSDPESYKVREGVVGGYVNHLTREQAGMIEAEMRNLDAFFGYGGGE
jgi:hypothetical protein